MGIGLPMNIDIYCDECRPDVLSSSKTKACFLGIGSVWTNQRQEIKELIFALKDKHKIGGEFKWTKVRQTTLPFYKELVDLFFSSAALKFRAIIINKNEIDIQKYHQNDPELGFYKMYYLMLNHRIFSEHNYRIFIDLKKNRQQNRVAILQKYLQNGTEANSITTQAIQSKESVFIQMADVFIGAVTAKFNSFIDTSSAKQELINCIDAHSKIEGKQYGELKFNIFDMHPHKEW